MKNRAVLKGFITAFLFGCLVCFWIKIGFMFLADVFSAKSETALENLDFSRSLKYSSEAIELNPQEPAYYRRRAKILLLSSSKKDALKDISVAIELNPKNLATLRNSIPLMHLMALQNLTEETVDLNYLPKTREFYLYLFETYPNDAGVLVSLASYQRKLGLKEDLDQTLHRISQLRLDLLEWHPLLVVE